MKKIIVLSLIAILGGYDCIAGNITISGKIENLDGESIKISGLFFDKHIEVNPDGTFSETFDIDYDGTYVMSTLNERFEIYLVQNTSMTIIADDSDFYKTAKFGGTNAAENQYLAEKSRLSNGLKLKETYMLEEVDFLEAVNVFKKSLLQNFNSQEFTSTDFKNLEAKNIHYWEQNYLSRYGNYHQAYGRLHKFKVSETFPKMDPTIEDEHERDFFFSIPYREIVRYKFYQKLSKAGIRNVTTIPSEIIKGYQSSYIQSMLLASYTYNIKADNPDATKLYEELMALSTNEPFKSELTLLYESMKNAASGKPSPTFDYENFNGGKTSLESLRGKYIYIDVWATWCAPCRAEIPHLKEVEAKFHGKNIEFVSISIDKRKDYAKWKAMITEKQLGGIQLIADNEWQSDFVRDYGIQGIPRFILIDPNGTIVDGDAPPPSDKKLMRLLKNLKL